MVRDRSALRPMPDHAWSRQSRKTDLRRGMVGCRSRPDRGASRIDRRGPTCLRWDAVRSEHPRLDRGDQKPWAQGYVLSVPDAGYSGGKRFARPLEWDAVTTGISLARTHYLRSGAWSNRF